ncbi:MAG: hypothetical protein RLZZ435_3474 [Cyanobacteriota bacterium]
MSIASLSREPLQHFVTQLREAGRTVGLDLGVEEILDIFWLAAQSEHQPISPGKREDQGFVSGSPQGSEGSSQMIDPSSGSSTIQKRDQETVSVTTEVPQRSEIHTALGSALPIQISAAKALRSQLELARALRPLMQKVPSRIQYQFDEEATATQAAEQRFVCPVLIPKPERWFDLAIVVEDSPSLKLWQETINELCDLAAGQGVFRHVKTWRLTSKQGALKLVPLWHQSAATQTSPLDPETVIKPERQLLWFISDCTSSLWDTPDLYRILAQWGKNMPLTVIQLFPERLWGRTAWV